MYSELSDLGVEIADGLSSPLNAAIADQDRDTMTMVRNALARKQAMLAYQPIVQAKAQGVVAFHEGLIRLLDDNGRIIPARDFIHVVEDNEMGRIIDCLALELGLQALREDASLRLSVNMSARSIGYPRWLQTLEHGLGIDRGCSERLILEITENSAMRMPEVVISFMSEMQRRGIAFALDDFGSGYTSFRYLRDFFFDVVKIDGQFIRGIAHSPDNQVLTRALVSISRQFDMFTVAESVETMEDASFLADAGVDCLQGYYFGVPTATSPREHRELAANRVGT